MNSYTNIVPTVFVVLASFGGLFVVVATLLRHKFGNPAVWAFWAIYIVAVSISCIYKLSGLRFTLSAMVIEHAVYLAGVAFVAVGIPLALGALVLTRLDQLKKRPPVLLQTAAAWATCMMLTPVAVVLVAAVDRLYWR